MNHLMIIAANSGIATEVARSAAAEGKELTLIARDGERLQSLAADLQARGAAKVNAVILDLADRIERRNFLDSIDELTCPDAILFAGAILPDEQKAREDFEEFSYCFEVNLLSIVDIVNTTKPLLLKRGAGTLGFISSVAGDRGRAVNYVYGSSKAALSTFADGLRLEVEARGIKVFTIKPGFVETAMTQHLELGPLAVSAERAGRAIYETLRGPGRVVYVPWFWAPIMFILRFLPESIFKRLPIG
jgi:short-subunit dehydrogenase